MTQPRPKDLPRVLGPWSASAIMIGVIIGSGIFQTPAEAAKHLGSPWVILAFWVVGGVLSLFGALIYSELACMYPQSGGVYVFIREAYGRCAAFVFGWSYMLLIKTRASPAPSPPPARRCSPTPPRQSPAPCSSC
ncbi:MAG: amino acid permease [Phycisphaerales bacterium]|jgi:APA family basic amino acid/polyamine antiporter